jgi:predicted transcriptional regulator
MVTQAWPEEGQIMIDRAKSGVEVRAILGRNIVFPKSVVNGIVPTIERLRPHANGRMAKRVDVAVYIADDRAAVMLPKSKGEVDMSTMLAGDDPAFVEWCSDLFDYMWARTVPMDVKKAKIV